MRRLTLLLFLLLLACAHAPVDRALLMGAWRSTHESFDFDIRETVIFYELDMQEHPYRLEGDLLIVDLGPERGINRSRIVKLTRDTLALEYLDSGTIVEYTRMR